MKDINRVDDMRDVRALLDWVYLVGAAWPDRINPAESDEYRVLAVGNVDLEEMVRFVRNGGEPEIEPDAITATKRFGQLLYLLRCPRWNWETMPPTDLADKVTG